MLSSWRTERTIDDGTSNENISHMKKSNSNLKLNTHNVAHCSHTDSTVVHDISKIERHLRPV